MPRRVVIAFALFLTVLPLAFAQSTGFIRGQVTDPSGSPVPGARVVLWSDTVTERTTTTGADGRFSFLGLSPGQYGIRVELAGFRTYQGSARAHAGRGTELNVVLHAGGVEEVVTVSSEPPPRRSKADAPALAPPLLPPQLQQSAPFNTEGYDLVEDNAFRSAQRDPLSTFSVDVDTASYANVRRFLNAGQLPPKDAVRIEEMINYFSYDYPEPEGAAPFSVTTEVGDCPWRPAHRLVLIGLQGRRLADAQMPPRNLVFLIDVSGSMDDPAKLPLVQASLQLLVEQLTARDRVAIVVYAGASGLVLPSTPGDRKERIRAAIDDLRAGGSTNGGAGIQLAYRVAGEALIEGGVNRVILATDGDFNVGVTSRGELLRLIEDRRRSGVFLSALGFGTGNYKDGTLEQLADRGNGNYAYIDSFQEARKVLVQETAGTLVTIAKDVKVQVELNPRLVESYRLVGYENRVLRNEDFKDDRKDAGDVGAGHSVTALYELVPRGAPSDAGDVDRLRYQEAGRLTRAARSDELMTVKLRHKPPDGDLSAEIVHRVAAARLPAAPSRDLSFASAVAAFGMLLRDSEHKGEADYELVRRLGRRSRGADSEGYRAEFLRLVDAAHKLSRVRAGGAR
jgi:Ca-activated chloride channel family protein